MTIISNGKKHTVVKLSPTGKIVLAWKPEEDKRKPQPKPPEPGAPFG